MIYGIIDLGSNTIRLSLYKYENGEIILLLNKKTMAGIAGYVKDGRLSKEGIKVACKVLKQYKDIINNFGLEKVFVFATASLRNISNTDEAVTEIKEETGFVVDVVLGEVEAIYDFVGASKALNIKEGIVFDIGGGSTEILMYKNREIIKAHSIPVGSLNMFSKYVKGIIPTKEEVKTIKKEVVEYLKDINGIDCSKTAYGVGGTTRNAGKLCARLFKADMSYIKPENIKKIFGKLHKSPKKLADKILKVCPDRIHTIIPGLVILRTLIDFYGIEEIYVSPYGVREGYLFDKVLSGGNEDE